MKELDSIADAMADHLHEVIEDSIDWAVDGTIVSELEGDEYYEACAHVINLAINKLIPKSAKLKREYSPIWFRPISEHERQTFPLNKDTPLIVGRLPAFEQIQVIERTNYKA